MGTLMLGVLASVVGSVIAWIISQEIQGWGPRVSENLVDRAVRRLADDLRDRYREEWQAYVLDKPTPVSKLYAALWLNFVAFRMARELKSPNSSNATAVDLALRMLDMTFAVFAIILLSPIMLFVIIAIRVTDPGPVFFAHRRVGKDGREFRLYKFRTMRVDSAEALLRHLQSNSDARAEWEATQKLRSDPRITRLGMYLRKTTLDETPGLFNVLSGSMSLIGPRPLVHEELHRYGKEIKEYTAVRPGLADIGWVFGREATSYASRVALTKYFRRNRSVRLYLVLLLRAIKALLSDSRSM